MAVGPSAKTWSVPKSTKRLPTHGYVFGTCVTKSGGCVVAILAGRGEWLLQYFDSNGSLLRANPTRQTKNSKCYEVYHVQETPEGHIAAASRTSVTVWSKDGKLIFEHGKNMFKFAKMIAVRSSGEIVVSDTDDRSVNLISAAGQQITKLSCTFQCPVGVTVDSNDNIIVADWDGKIRIFDDCNEIIRTFGTKGDQQNEFDCPYGLAVDCEDNIIVADMWNNRISLFTFEGQFIRYLGYDTARPAYVSVSTRTDVNLKRLLFSDFTGASLIMFDY